MRETLWFYLLGHGRGQYVAYPSDIDLFYRMIRDEVVSYQRAPGDHTGKPPSRDIPGIRFYKGAEYDHYE